ncbi:MAG: redoxin domain-containing protein [Gammaproteobacteria bacterium]|nr:redoxin domain-containing protein [Gammaproteobacteria bacterium]
MKSECLSVFFGIAVLTLLTSCGSSKGVLTGDFTEFDDQFDGAKLELSYYDRSLEERVLLGSGVVENGKLSMNISFDEEVPIFAWVSFKYEVSDQSREMVRRVIVEEHANYTVEILDPENFWYRVDSDGTYAKIFVPPKQDEIRQHELRLKHSNLVQQFHADSSNNTAPTEQDSSTPTDSEPSVHAAILDWENMSCADYAAELELFQDRERFREPPAETDEIREVRQELQDLFERMYTQRTQEILDTSSDPIEQLLTLEFSFGLDWEQRIPILEELSEKLPSEVVEKRVTPRLDDLIEFQKKHQANEALRLGTIIPSIEVTLLDQSVVPLSSILQENRVVVLGVWDNYCQWCIEAFERYREFYSRYEKLGFEVVSLSFEYDRADWEEKSKELDLPWINAYAPDGYDGKISTLYGIQYPRANYVLDSEGCILKRDLTPNELLDFLGARLDS